MATVVISIYFTRQQKGTRDKFWSKIRYHPHFLPLNLDLTPSLSQCIILPPPPSVLQPPPDKYCTFPYQATASRNT